MKKHYDILINGKKFKIMNYIIHPSLMNRSD